MGFAFLCMCDTGMLETCHSGDIATLWKIDHVSERSRLSSADEAYDPLIRASAGLERP